MRLYLQPLQQIKNNDENRKTGFNDRKSRPQFYKLSHYCFFIVKVAARLFQSDIILISLLALDQRLLQKSFYPLFF